MTAQVTTIFDAMESHPDWCGWGYLGERKRFRSAEDPDSYAALLGEAKVNAIIAKSDQAVLDYADAQGWSEAQLFEWANSRAGRHFADAAFSGESMERCINAGLLDLPDDPRPHGLFGARL